MHLTVYQRTVSHISFSAHTFFARLREQHQTSDDAVRSLPSAGSLRRLARSQVRATSSGSSLGTRSRTVASSPLRTSRIDAPKSPICSQLRSLGLKHGYRRVATSHHKHGYQTTSHQPLCWTSMAPPESPRIWEGYAISSQTTN